MKNPKISVILPIFNVDKYLEKSVNAILYQTYDNIEIILVDDGSTDSSGAICDILKKQDKRIKVIHQENAGVSAARNKGLEKATGEYIAFCDPDDCPDVEMYAKLMTSIKENNSDIALCGFKNVYENSGEIVVVKECNLKKIESTSIFPYLLKIGTRKISNKEAETNNIMGCVWRGLYKRSALDGVQFESVSVCEDLIFTIDVFAREPNVSVVEESLYSYLQRDTSIMHTFNEKKFYNRIKAYKILIERLENLVEKPDLGAYKFHIYSSLINDLLKNNRKDIFRDIIKDDFIVSLNTKENYNYAKQYVIGLKFKVAYFLLHHKKWWVYSLILKMMK